ncbi:class I SAM-dependent methyltransferase ASCRUDRAFT_70051 [Ascoidea rubescens DSM 1968]|uniref:Methyltransferase type 11 domain-containing protein n=1 Tax=Ascoidea rubescens DSM 1968 TaxID=1344418 RepID=A0A1D2VJ57_9ASCO|nr:hypothetical protein ASCRUDRAFT_70051 [Ascoidea rubescens DSM 1968]ODV61573.1 hypothetical protein ASCRUDRAFT_70051 [Ascoidea rubescens DSM 1968]
MDYRNFAAANAHYIELMKEQQRAQQEKRLRLKEEKELEKKNKKKNKKEAKNKHKLLQTQTTNSSNTTHNSNNSNNSNTSTANERASLFSKQNTIQSSNASSVNSKLSSINNNDYLRFKKYPTSTSHTQNISNQYNTHNLNKITTSISNSTSGSSSNNTVISDSHRHNISSNANIISNSNIPNNDNLPASNSYHSKLKFFHFNSTQPNSSPINTHSNNTIPNINSPNNVNPNANTNTNTNTNTTNIHTPGNEITSLRSSSIKNSSSIRNNPSSLINSSYTNSIRKSDSSSSLTSFANTNTTYPTDLSSVKSNNSANLINKSSKSFRNSSINFKSYLPFSNPINQPINLSHDGSGNNTGINDNGSNANNPFNDPQYQLPLYDLTENLSTEFLSSINNKTLSKFEFFLKFNENIDQLKLFSNANDIDNFENHNNNRYNDDLIHEEGEEEKEDHHYTYNHNYKELFLNNSSKRYDFFINNYFTMENFFNINNISRKYNLSLNLIELWFIHSHKYLFNDGILVNNNIKRLIESIEFANTNTTTAGGNSNINPLKLLHLSNELDVYWSWQLSLDVKNSCSVYNYRNFTNSLDYGNSIDKKPKNYFVNSGKTFDNLPYQAGYFDLIYSNEFNFSLNYKNCNKILTELYRILNKNGYVELLLTDLTVLKTQNDFEGENEHEDDFERDNNDTEGITNNEEESDKDIFNEANYYENEEHKENQNENQNDKDSENENETKNSNSNSNDSEDKENDILNHNEDKIRANGLSKKTKKTIDDLKYYWDKCLKNIDEFSINNNGNGSGNGKEDNKRLSKNEELNIDPYPSFKILNKLEEAGFKNIRYSIIGLPRFNISSNRGSQEEEFDIEDEYLKKMIGLNSLIEFYTSYWEFKFFQRFGKFTNEDFDNYAYLKRLKLNQTSLDSENCSFNGGLNYFIVINAQKVL